MKITSAGVRLAAQALLLGMLSVLPYTMVYVIDRGLGAQDAARSALWPAAVVPLLVGAVGLAELLRGGTARKTEVAGAGW